MLPPARNVTSTNAQPPCAPAYPAIPLSCTVEFPMKISVIGCGYLGAVHAASMAELGHDVVGIDVDDRKVALLQQAKAPFYEPGFEDLLERTLSSGRLSFSADMAAAAGSLVHFVCVGTPQRRG